MEAMRRGYVRTAAVASPFLLASPQERGESGGDRLWCLFGHVVTGVERHALQRAFDPRPPDRDRVTVQLLEVVLQGPADQRRTRHPAAGRAVGGLVVAVDVR